MWITDPKSKEPSVTITFFTLGFIVCILKLLISGVSVGTIKLGTFSGSDFSLAVGSLGAIYVARRHSDNTTKDKEE